MTWEERKRITNDYYAWFDSRHGLIDCPENVLAFVDRLGYLRDKPLEDEPMSQEELDELGKS